MISCYLQQVSSSQSHHMQVNGVMGKRIYGQVEKHFLKVSHRAASVELIVILYLKKIISFDT